MTEEIAKDPSSKALDKAILALGELFSVRISQLSRQVAIATCDGLANGKLKLVYNIELAPLKLVCSVRGPENSVELFVVEGGYASFGFAEKDRPIN